MLLLHFDTQARTLSSNITGIRKMARAITSNPVILRIRIIFLVLCCIKNTPSQAVFVMVRRMKIQKFYSTPSENKDILQEMIRFSESSNRTQSKEKKKLRFLIYKKRDRAIRIILSCS